MESINVKGFGGQITLTEKRVIIERKGMLAKASHGSKGNKEIPLKNITAVQFKSAGMSNGYIQFSILGGNESTGGVFDAAKDENSVMFTKKQEPMFQEVKRFIDAYIDEEPISIQDLNIKSPQKEKNSKRKKTKNIAKYLYGIIFLIAGFSLLFTLPLVGIVAFLLGLFILPPSLKFIENKINFVFPTPLKWTIVIAGLFLMGFAMSKSNEINDNEVDKIVEKASQAIDKGNMDSAYVYIDKAKKQYSTANNNKAVKLEKEIENSQSEDYAKEVLAKMTDEDFNQLQNGNLTKSYINQKTLNKNFYAILNDLAPQRQKIVEEIKKKEEQERIAAELEAERKKQAELDRKRKEKVEKQFSTWDGSHPALTRLIKENMNDPDSYDHIETRFRDDGSSIFVITKFRGANAFGGKVINTVSARVDFDGNVIEIISQN